MNDPGTAVPESQGGEPASAEAAPFVAYTHVPQAEAWLERYLGKGAAFQLPERSRDGFVRYFPWVALAFLPLHLLAVLALIGLSFLSALFGHVSLFSGVFALAILACDVLALPGLFARTRQGWTFFAYALALGAVSQLLRFSLFGLVIQIALLWIAFQVKYRYRYGESESGTAEGDSTP